MMKDKCKYCGRVLTLKELIQMPDDTYICIPCWNTLKINKCTQDLKIKILGDGIPAIVIPPNILISKKIYTNGSTSDIESNLEPYYYQIVDNSDLDLSGLRILVKNKMEEFKGLVSEETALFMISKDLGIDLRDDI